MARLILKRSGPDQIIIELCRMHMGLTSRVLGSQFWTSVHDIVCPILPYSVAENVFPHITVYRMDVSHVTNTFTLGVGDSREEMTRLLM